MEQGQETKSWPPRSGGRACGGGRLRRESTSLQPGRRPINCCFLVSTKNGKWGTPDRQSKFPSSEHGATKSSLSLPFRSIAVPK